jgi:hypothetical protein
MISTPRWLFLIPGFVLILLGLLGYAVAMPRMVIAGVTFDVHTLLFASVSILCGYQSVLFSVLAKTFAISEGLLPPDPRLTRLYDFVYLETGLAAAGVTLLAGLGLLGTAVLRWKAVAFGPLDYTVTMRLVIPGVTLTALGFQTFLSSFFLSILGMARR